MSLDNDERRPLTNAERQQRFRAQRNVLAASVDLKAYVPSLYQFVGDTQYNISEATSFYGR